MNSRQEPESFGYCGPFKPLALDARNVGLGMPSLDATSYLCYMYYNS
jgi:hypothetical protein